MLELDWRVRTRDGVALVELVVSNPTATARRVRVADRLDGPVWPPRREGVPEAGWDDGGFEGVVAPGDRRALGYASPAPESLSTADTDPAASTADAADAADSTATDTADSTADTDADTADADAASTADAAALAEPPAELVWSERAGASETDGRALDADGSSDAFTDEATPEGVVRALGDARPPADAVPSRSSASDSDGDSPAPAERSP